MIREYCFSCEKCAYEFSKEYDWDKIYKPTCPNCSSVEVYRDYSREKVITDDCVPKTLGALADKNSKMKGIKINGKD